MSAKDETKFLIGLKHLSAECKEAAANLPDLQVDGVSPKKLRAMLKAMGALAPKVVYPVAPELRVTTHDKFVVQVKEGQLRLISWSTAQPAGGAMSPDQIFSAITGEQAVEEEYRPRSSKGSAGARGENPARNRLIIGLCIVGIIVFNSFTVWISIRPARSLLPNYTVLPPEPAERLLSSVVGAYETGNGTTSRRLEIQKDGSASWVKYNSSRKVVQERKFTVQGVQVEGKPSLVTSRKSMIEIKDPVTVIMYGDPYKRIAK